MLSESKREAIYDELNALDLLLGSNVGQPRLIAYVVELESFDLNALINSIRGFRRRAIFFPKVAEIINDLASLGVPSEDLAIAISSEIIECISKYGPYQVNEVKAYLGDKYGIVERFGRWQDICMVEYDELPSMRAQLRGLALVYINKSKREMIERGDADFRINTNPIIIGRNGEEGKPVKMIGDDIDLEYYLNEPINEEILF